MHLPPIQGADVTLGSVEKIVYENNKQASSRQNKIAQRGYVFIPGRGHGRYNGRHSHHSKMCRPQSK